MSVDERDFTDLARGIPVGLGHRPQLDLAKIRWNDAALPTVASKDEMFQDLLRAKELLNTAQYRPGPPQPRKIRVAEDVLEKLLERTRCNFPATPIIDSYFGIPIEVDEELPPGGWKPVYW